ncbi:MAG: hypothetical protein AVDCRST_MAG10-474, partial [uncultured Acidimicrobiales bacterium]
CWSDRPPGPIIGRPPSDVRPMSAGRIGLPGRSSATSFGGCH